MILDAIVHGSGGIAVTIPIRFKSFDQKPDTPYWKAKFLVLDEQELTFELDHEHVQAIERATRLGAVRIQLHLVVAYDDAKENRT